MAKDENGKGGGGGGLGGGGLCPPMGQQSIICFYAMMVKLRNYLSHYLVIISTKLSEAI